MGVLLVFPVSEQHSLRCSLSDLLAERVCQCFCINIMTKSDVNGVEDAVCGVLLPDTAVSRRDGPQR